MSKGCPPPRGVEWPLVPGSSLRPVMSPRVASTCGSGMRILRLPLLWATPTPNATCARCTRRSCRHHPRYAGTCEKPRCGAACLHDQRPAGTEPDVYGGEISALRPVLGSVLIQTDAAVSPGSSGGGLFDRPGRLIGMPCFQLQEGQHLNFALPVDWIVNVALRPVRHTAPSSGAILPDWVQRSTALRTPKNILAPVKPSSND